MRYAPSLIALLLLFAAACDGGGSAGPPSASRPPEVSAAVLASPSAAGILSSATTTPRASEPASSNRPAPVHVPAITLAVSWSAYLGRRVSLRCRPVRRIDFAHTIVVAAGERFVVVGPPGVTPCSARTSTFTVVGSTSASLGGRTVLAELLLEDGDGEDPAL